MVQIIETLNDYGIFGLYMSMLLEGSSIPFPGLAVVLTLGNFLDDGLLQLLAVALGMSLAYCAASFIPYLVGLKFQAKIPDYMFSKIRKVQLWFVRYGELSICLSRPFGIGNYISYVAGMSKVNPVRYAVLTLLGIFPWAFSILLLATIYKAGGEVHWLGSYHFGF
ncbi:VTT domain-containing protein [Metallumcola ferriviriculae]|uniref:VTT domain-containing protein n=1 Tax=Metallumcola ferriviriculae TaxID=3039180 RepID=A0AAU0UQ77_9FIRM|nr:VTT domain-containing protein [Desulfitibacteraceae bacterium MK1]